MSAGDQLRAVIDQQLRALSSQVPVDRNRAIVSLIRVLDREQLPRSTAPVPHPVTGNRLPNLGGNLALKFCLEHGGPYDVPDESDGELDGWAEGFLRDCGLLAEASGVLGHLETGFMRVDVAPDGGFDAWIASRREPTSWRERADFDWWASWLTSRQQDAASDRADAHLAAMAYQLGYPADAVVDGCSIGTYCGVLRWLIADVLAAEERGDPTEYRSERDLVSTMAARLPAGPATIQRALSAFVLDRENAEYHAAVPGVAAAPLVRIDDDRMVLSRYGVTNEPLLFMCRELRRKSPEQYHNSAVQREEVFRQDLYALFADKRFITSPGRIELRRASGNVRTDIDAAIFDKKTGTLALFELKSQDPFARSITELVRQRDNLLYANRQVSGILNWLNRSGAADDLLGRVDRRAARTFRAQRVLPFVIGRYLAHFSDGPEPDRRAAWATWPQILQLTDGKPFGAKEGNPLASLFNRLTNVRPAMHQFADMAPRTMSIGDRHLTMYPSSASAQTRTPSPE